MNLSTDYLGLKLKNPLMPGASPMSGNLDMARRLEDAGAAAIVMSSLFEEQVVLAERKHIPHAEMPSVYFGEPEIQSLQENDFPLSPDEYLKHVARLKGALGIPVIASMNGVSPGNWIDYARGIEQAGADALELNFYEISTDGINSAVDIEVQAIEMVETITHSVKIPVAVKLSPFFSSLPHFASNLVSAGASGLVFFNRFYQADINIEEMEAQPALHFSEPGELLLRLRWLAIVSATVNTSYAASGGVHNATSAIKAIMAGAHAVQLVSILIKRGPEFLQTILHEMEDWCGRHGYDSLSQIRAAMNLGKTSNPSAFERTGYIRTLQGCQV
ncbi:MAG TPA: dihydroorotate dehydrogenase-like protein [Chthoniobacteraceae bacterium]|nr:dihydroorotate dehydrogenase-like protein [Chthoniobacteraceae bacterium]